MKRRSLAVILATAVAGCSGHASLPPTPKAAVSPAVQFTMHWPSSSTVHTDTRVASTSRKPLYISPSTQSVIVVVNPQANPVGPITFANKPTKGSTTNISINAPPGQDTFAIELYDQPQTTGEAAPAGNLLGQTTVAQTIKAGTSNTISATVDGVVASLSLTPLSNQPTVETLSSGFALVGTEPVTFTMNALDADGNVIVPPGNAPAMGLSANTASLSVSPVPGATNQYTVQVIAPSPVSSAPPELTATATDSLGDFIGQVSNISIRAGAYVGYKSGGVALYDDQDNVINLPSGAFSGVKDAAGLAYDYDDNRVFVADAAQSALLAFDPLGTSEPGFTPVSLSGITGVAYDSNNKTVYATSNVGVTAYNIDGSAASAPGIPISNATCIAYVSDDRGNPVSELAVGTGGASPSIIIYSEAGNIVQTIPLPSAPTGVAFFPTLNGGGSPYQLYVVRSGNIDAYTLDGTSSTTVADANSPFAISIDNDNLPYVTDQSTNAVAPYGPSLQPASSSDFPQLSPPSGSPDATPQGLVMAY